MLEFNPLRALWIAIDPGDECQLEMNRETRIGLVFRHPQVRNREFEEPLVVRVDNAKK